MQIIPLVAPWRNINSVKIIEQSEVSPPPGSIPTTSLPLTFFDLPWLPCPHMQRLYFYEFPHSTHHFLSTLLPTLKHSLSHALHHFFTLAAALVCPLSPPEKPYILFSEGDSVPLTVAESHADFHFLAARHPRPAEALQPLVPNLQPPHGCESDKTHNRVAGPLLALQVTVFPLSGICIGVRFCHMAGDGSAFNHFMRSWALVCKKNGPDDRLTLPSHYRAVINDPDGLELVFLDDYWQQQSLVSCNELDPKPTAHDDYVRATFVVGRARIEKLKRCVNTNVDDSATLRVSSFVVTSALIWVCLIKSEEEKEESTFTEDEPCHFVLLLDCRDRLENLPIPTTYFGNCLAACFIEVKRKDLGMGEIYGTVAAAKAIGKKVGEVLGSGGALGGADKWMVKWRELQKQSHHLLTIAGSSRPGIYEPDFGWGRLKRMEMVHVEGPGSIYVASSTEEKGGIDVGLALSKERMSSFSAILEESLMNLDLN